MTGSWRMKKRWETASDYRYTLGGSIDYTGSFDRIKSDKDIDEGVSGRPLERYKASYNSLSAALNFSAAAKEQSAFFRSFDLSASVDADFDITDRWKYMIGQRQRADPHGAGGGGLRRRDPAFALRGHPARGEQAVLRLRQGDGVFAANTRSTPQHAARGRPSGRWPRTTAADCSTT